MDRAENLNEKSRAPDIPPTSYDDKPTTIYESSRDSIRSRGLNDESLKEEYVDQKKTDGEKTDQADEEQANEGDVERVVSKQPSVNNAAAIPNGGFWAWMQVLGSFFLFFNSWYAASLSSYLTIQFSMLIVADQTSGA